MSVRFPKSLQTALLTLSLVSLPTLANAKGGGGKGKGGPTWVAGTSSGGGGGNGGGMKGWKVALIVLGSILGLIIIILFCCRPRAKPLSETKPRPLQESSLRDLEAGRDSDRTHTRHPYLERQHESHYLGSSGLAVPQNAQRPDYAHAKFQLSPPPSPYQACRGSSESTVRPPVYQSR